jgi:hypothetical protein
VFVNERLENSDFICSSAPQNEKGYDMQMKNAYQYQNEI